MVLVITDSEADGNYSSGPLRASLGSWELSHSLGPLQAASPRGIAGPLRHCGAQDSLPPVPPLDGPAILTMNIQHIVDKELSCMEDVVVHINVAS